MLRQYLADVIKFSTEDGAVVYVADNASTDDSIELLETHFTSCRIVRLEKNWGFAEGYNKALKEIDAEYYVLLNSDIRVTRHWLQPLVQFMDNHKEAAACQPKLLSMTDNSSLSTREHRVASSTDTDTHSVVEGFSTQWSVTTDSMTMWHQYSGPRELHCSYARPTTGRLEDSTDDSSPTTRK